MSEQLALDYSARKLARRRDPGTSHAAAQGDRSTNRMRLLAVFAAAWPQGLTYEQAAGPARMERHEAARRIADLTRLDLLEVAVLGGHAQLRHTASGREARVHRATDAGKREARAD